MNKIIVAKDKIISDNCEGVEINDNTLKITSDLEIYIIYENSSITFLNVDILENRKVKIYEFISSNKLDITYNLKENSTVNLYRFAHQLSTLKTVINLNGINAKIDFNFANIGSNNSKYLISVNHNAKGVKSNIVNHALALNNSFLDYTVESILPTSINEVVMEQITKVVLLGNSSSKVEPIMYINHDDVIGKHGNTIGKFNDDEIFYLMSRGISKNEAIKLLIKGFIFAIIEGNLNFREDILKIILKVGGENDE